MQNNDNFRRGTVELVVLCILTQKDMYGYEIVKTISRMSNQFFELPLGTLYPILYRFVESGYISDRDEIVNKRMRKYYHLEDKGKEYYSTLLDEYKRVANGVDLILRTVNENE